MNKRILEILSMCLLAKENGHDCFFNYSPHVKQIDVRIFLNGWENYQDPDHGLTAYTNIKSPLYKESELEIIENILIELI